MINSSMEIRETALKLSKTSPDSVLPLSRVSSEQILLLVTSPGHCMHKHTLGNFKGCSLLKQLRTNLNYSSFLFSNGRMGGFSPP